MSPVIEHNANDLIALAAMLVAMSRRMGAIDPQDEAVDHLCLAQVAMRAGNETRALEFFAAAADGGEDRIASEALFEAARVAKRAGDHARARRWLHEALDRAAPEQEGVIHLALAKLYEHQIRNLACAIEHARHAATAETLEANERRLARLEKRVLTRGGLL